MTDVPEVMSVREVKKALDLTQQTVYKLISDGRLKGFRVGNQWRVYRASFNELINESREDTPFVVLLKKTFSDEESEYRRVLELRYRDCLDRSTVGEELGVTEARVHHLTIDALLALQPALKAGLVYDDVSEDSFALRVLAQIFLAQEE